MDNPLPPLEVLKTEAKERGVSLKQVLEERVRAAGLPENLIDIIR